jgi:hypothetical protein
MFGCYDIPFELEKEGIALSIENEGKGLVYRSACAGARLEKILLAKTGEVFINPIEPLNKPKELTSNLLIEFEKALLIEPEATRKIFITYPIEIGVLISTKTAVEVLDIFTLVRQKFTLYGDPRSGVICKYWVSNVYSSIPSINPLHEGIIELSITNTTKRWVTVTKAIFNAYGMKIYYRDDLVAMKASMKIVNGSIAETDFFDAPLEPGMKKSLELYTVRQPVVTTTKFIMEAGL